MKEGRYIEITLNSKKEKKRKGDRAKYYVILHTNESHLDQNNVKNIYAIYDREIGLS